jgi:hypothetical protein
MPTMIAKPIMKDGPRHHPLWPKSESLIRDPLLQDIGPARRPGSGPERVHTSVPVANLPGISSSQLVALQPSSSPPALGSSPTIPVAVPALPLDCGGGSVAGRG